MNAAGVPAQSAARLDHQTGSDAFSDDFDTPGLIPLTDTSPRHRGRAAMGTNGHDTRFVGDDSLGSDARSVANPDHLELRADAHVRDPREHARCAS
jgi:hypothetical protein